jgi:hypothetical protein
MTITNDKENLKTSLSPNILDQDTVIDWIIHLSSGYIQINEIYCMYIKNAKYAC